MQALEPDEDESTSETFSLSTADWAVPSQSEENASLPIAENSSVDIAYKEPTAMEYVADDVATQPLLSVGSLHDEFEPCLSVSSSETGTVNQFNVIQDENAVAIEPRPDQSFEIEGAVKPELMDLGEDVADSYPDSIDDQVDAPMLPSPSQVIECNVEFEVEESLVVKVESSALEITAPDACLEETVTCQGEDILKLDVSSEDEEVNFYLKSGAESSSSKEESPSGPSCSGTSRAGINSLSSGSEEDLPNVDIPLPIKKRKRVTNVETIGSSSCSEDENKCEEIDYANLKPEEIKALIEEARRYGKTKRKCKCPKNKCEEIKGPTETSGKCNIGKGDWSETLSLPCAACSAGACRDSNHRHGRRRRKGTGHLPRVSLLKPRARGTIGEDVPIIDLSDSEEVSPASNKTTPEVTITTIPPAGECIVLSSSDDDDDVVCEGVIKPDVKNVISKPPQPSEAPEKIDSPDVVVLNASLTPTITSPTVTITNSIPSFLPLNMTLSSPSLPPPLPPLGQVPLPPIPQVTDAEPWPDCNIDLDNWDETFNFLANIAGPGGLGPEANPSVATPERPSTPEGWSCPICLEPKTGVNEIMSTTCGHVFCGNCIRSAVRLHKKCPTCRKKLTTKQFHKIFL